MPHSWYEPPEPYAFENWDCVSCDSPAQMEYHGAPHCYDCVDEAEAAEQYEAERKAEFAMSWVSGGGQPEDVNAAYRFHHGQQ